MKNKINSFFLSFVMFFLLYINDITQKILLKGTPLAHPPIYFYWRVRYLLRSKCFGNIIGRGKFNKVGKIFNYYIT